jgi:ATP phosphoribosyltransferase
VSALLIGLPSKGRVHDEVVKWLAGAGLALMRDADGRGYRARLENLDGAEVWLLSAGEIAASLETGKIHAGVTGLDLMHERAGGVGPLARPLKGLGFARARVVVAVPDGWMDVETIADVVDVAARHFERTRARLRVATKYPELARRFFAAMGLRDYRIVASLGATEGAPAAGVAELIVDITETGATLGANHLKILEGGVILESQAVLAGSLAAPWSAENVAAFRRVMAAAGMPEAQSEMFAQAAIANLSP